MSSDVLADKDFCLAVSSEILRQWIRKVQFLGFPEVRVESIRFSPENSMEITVLNGVRSITTDVSFPDDRRWYGEKAGLEPAEYAHHLIIDRLLDV